MDSVVSFAGSIPANYEKYLGPFLFEPYAVDLASQLQDKKYPAILELACGTGRVTAHLAKSVQHDEITATDLNPDMIEEAKRIVKSESIKWMVADALELPFDDNSFDTVVCQFGIMFFPDKLKGLQEAYRVLKPGGRLIFNTWDDVKNIPAIHEGRKIIESYFDDDPPIFYNIPFSMHNEKELTTLMNDAGFKNAKTTLVIKDGTSDAESLSIGMVEGNPILLAITEKDPKLVKPIEEHIRKMLAEKFGDNPLKSPLQAWVCEAVK